MPLFCCEINEGEVLVCHTCDKRLELNGDWLLMGISNDGGVRGFFCPRCYILLHEDARLEARGPDIVVIQSGPHDDDDAR